MLFGFAALATTSAASSPLDEAHESFRQGKTQAARQALATLDLNKLERMQASRYWRLRFELDLETAQYSDAVAAGLACRKHFDTLRHVDYVDLGTFSTHLARAYEMLGQADAAEKQLHWALARWLDAGKLSSQQRQLVDPQGRIELTRLQVAAELTRLQSSRLALASQSQAQAKPHWDPTIADARKWLSDYLAGDASLESRMQCVEILIGSLLACGERQSAVEAVDGIAARAIAFLDPLDHPRWLANLARQYQRLGQLQATTKIEQAIASVSRIRPTDAARSKQRDRIMADLAFDAAQLHHRAANAERALELIRLAREKYGRLEAGTSDVRDRQQFLSRLVQLAVLAGDRNESVRMGRQWVAVQEAELDPLDPRRLLARVALASLCVAANETAEVSKLVREEDLNYFRQRQPLDVQNWGSALLVLCQAEADQRQYTVARARLQRDRETWNRHLATADLLRIKLEAQLAELFVVEGDYRTAIKILVELPSALGETGADEPEYSERTLLLSQVLLSLGLAHEAQGHFDEAYTNCHAAYEVRNQAVSAEASKILPYHLALCRLGLHQLIEGTRQSAGEIGKMRADARLHTDAAYKIIESAQQTDTLNCAHVLYHRGLLHEYEKDVTAALDDWHRALEIARQHSSGDILRCRLQVQIGRRLAAQSRLDDAEQHLSEATQQLEKLGILPGLRYAALCTRAQVLLTLDRKNRAGDDATTSSPGEELALMCLTQAVELMEFPRTATTNGELARAQYFARYAMAYDLLVDLLAVRFDRTKTEEDYDKALYYADRSRNRTLLDHLAATENQLVHSLGPDSAELLSERAKLLQECLDCEAELLALQNQSPNADERNEADLAAKQSALKSQLHVRRELYAKCHARLQDLFRLKIGLAAAYPTCDLSEWRDVLSRLLQSGNFALVYHASPHGSHLFLLTDKIRRHWRLRAPLETGQKANVASAPLTVAQLANLVDGYRRIVSDPKDSSALLRDPSRLESAGGVRSGEQLQNYGYTVGQVILPEECREELLRLERNGNGLIVVPDGPLQRLPLESLIWERGSPPVFAADCLPPLVYTPSLMTLERILVRRGRAETPPLMLIALGLADYSQWQRTDLIDLNGAPAEAEAIATEFAQAHPTGHSEKLLNAQASESRLRGALALRPCTHLHLAAHAEVGEQSQGLFGRILLVRPADRLVPEDDGALYAHEVLTLPLSNCELVFLSGCSTNVGPAVPLECASSLLRAFVSAGARRVLGSHWAVDDNSTSQLMKHFVDRLWSGEGSSAPDYARSLQAARKEVRKIFPDPYHWAPFVLYGPGR